MVGEGWRRRWMSGGEGEEGGEDVDFSGYASNFLMYKHVTMLLWQIWS